MDTKPHPRPQPRYPGPLNHENIIEIFSGAGDFDARQLAVGTERQTVYLYSVDGLVSSGDISDFIVKPLMKLKGTVDGTAAMETVVYNAVASRVEDLDGAASMLVNGFCVVLFSEGDAVAFEVKTGEKRSISSPEVENTVKGAKDAFTEDGAGPTPVSFGGICGPRSFGWRSRWWGGKASQCDHLSH